MANTRQNRSKKKQAPERSRAPLVLIVMMLFRPTGLLGTYEFSLSRMLNRPRKAAIQEGGKQA